MILIWWIASYSAKLLSQLNKVARIAQNPSLVMLSMTAKQALKAGVDFSKINKMIDDMVVVLKKEAGDDIKARDSCAEGFRTSEATRKETEHAIKGILLRKAIRSIRIRFLKLGKEAKVDAINSVVASPDEFILNEDQKKQTRDQQ